MSRPVYRPAADYEALDEGDDQPSTSGDALPTELQRTVKAHTGAICAVRYNRQGVYAMSCGRDRTVVLWNPQKGLRIKTYEGHGYEVRDVSISADNTKFASCGGDKQVFLWDVASGATIRKFQGHDLRVNSVKFGASDSILVSGGEDKAVKVWDLRSGGGKEVQAMQPFRDSVSAVAMHPDRPEIIAGSVDGTIRRFDIRAGYLFSDDLHHPVVHVSLTHDGNCVLAACLDSACRLLDREEGDLLFTYRGHLNNSIKLEAATSASDAHVLCGSEDGKVYAWALLDGALEAELDAGSAAVVTLAASPAGDGMVTGSSDGTLRVWGRPGRPSG